MEEIVLKDMNWEFAYEGSDRIEAFEKLSAVIDMTGAPRSIIAGIINCLEPSLVLTVKASGSRKNEVGISTTIHYEMKYKTKGKQITEKN